jgi:hypothetical protein
MDRTSVGGGPKPIEEIVSSWKLAPTQLSDLTDVAIELLIDPQISQAHRETLEELAEVVLTLRGYADKLKVRKGLEAQLRALKKIFSNDFASYRGEVIRLQREFRALGVDLACMKRAEELAFEGPQLILERSGWAERLRMLPKMEDFGLKKYQPDPSTHSNVEGPDKQYRA